MTIQILTKFNLQSIQAFRQMNLRHAENYQPKKHDFQTERTARQNLRCAFRLRQIVPATHHKREVRLRF